MIVLHGVIGLVLDQIRYIYKGGGDLYFKSTIQQPEIDAEC